jgi:hypothetical protein
MGVKKPGVLRLFVIWGFSLLTEEVVFHMGLQPDA